MKEIVFASDASVIRVHQELYHSPDDAYRVVHEDLLTAISSLAADLSRFHVVACWRDLVRIAAWKEEPKIGDLLLLLKSTGLKSEELLPFARGSVADVFPWLYYGRRFETLRKLCLAAKTAAERRLLSRDARAYCHLVDEEATKIVASSL